MTYRPETPKTPLPPPEAAPDPFENRRDAIFAQIATMRHYAAVAVDSATQKMLDDIHARVDRLRETDEDARSVLKEEEGVLAAMEEGFDEDDFF